MKVEGKWREVFEDESENPWAKAHISCVPVFATPEGVAPPTKVGGFHPEFARTEARAPWAEAQGFHPEFARTEARAPWAEAQGFHPRSPWLFIAEGFDGVQARGARRGVKSSGEADDDGESDRACNHPPRNR